MGVRMNRRVMAAVTLVVALGMAAPALAVDAPKWVAAIYVQAQSAIGLRWNAVAGATEYKVLRSTTAGTGYEVIGTVSAGQYFDKAVEPGATYYYVLQAIAGGTPSANSDEKSVAIPGEKKVEPVKPVTWDKVTPQSSLEFGKRNYKVGLFWNRNVHPNVVAYNVYRSVVAGKDYALILSTQETKAIDDKVEEGKTYFYVVTALDNQFQETAYSTEQKVTLEKPADVPVAAPAKKKYPDLVPIPVKVDEPIAAPNYVSDMVIGDAGLYVAAGRVYLSTDGGASFPNPIEPDLIVSASSVSIGIDGELIVTDGVSRKVFVVTKRGAKSFELPLPEKGVINPDTKKEYLIQNPVPYGAIQNIDGKFWVTDNLNARVVILDENFKFLRNAGEEAVSDALPQATGIYRNSKGRVFAISGSSNAVMIFEADGSFVKRFGETGNVAGTFARIGRMAVDGKDNLLIADLVTSTIQKYDSNGEFLGAFSGADKKSGLNLVTPNVIAVEPDGKTGFVSESIAQRIRKFNILE
jgi:hypothetical protein